MKATIPVALQPGTKILQLYYDRDRSAYVLWLHHDRLYKNGTFLELYADGVIERVTLRPDDTEERFRVS